MFLYWSGWVQVQEECQEPQGFLRHLFPPTDCHYNCDHHSAHFSFNNFHASRRDWENCCHKWYTDICCFLHAKVNTEETHPRHLYTAQLTDSPVVSCLSLSTLSVSLGPDLGSNTYLNGFRYLNMNCAWNFLKHMAGTVLTEEYLLVR